MARRLRSPTLETRNVRLRLPVQRKPYWINVSAGVGLGYRRNLGPGSWSVRWSDGKGGYLSQAFAIADDFEDADGDQVLDFWARSEQRRVGKGCRSSGA